MSINVWDWGGGAVYLGDTLIAGWGWGGDGVDFITIPVQGNQNRCTCRACFTYWKIYYANCCWFQFYHWQTYASFTCYWYIVYTWCSVLVSTPSNLWLFTWVTADCIRRYESRNYWGYDRNWCSVVCSSTPAGYIPLTYDCTTYNWLYTTPLFGSQSYDYIDLIVWFKNN